MAALRRDVHAAVARGFSEVMVELLNQGGSHDSEAAEDGTSGLSVVRRAMNGPCPYLPARAAQCSQYRTIQGTECKSLAVQLEVWCAVCGNLEVQNEECGVTSS